MVAKTIISRVGKIDFFAVLPSGTYSFVSIYIALGIDHGNTAPPETLWASLDPLIQLTHERPSIILLILFSAYLLGSVLRSVPVSFSEKMMCLTGERFPYQESIKGIIDGIKCNPEASKINTEYIPDISKDMNIQIYNYWKDIVCIGSPEGFSNYQEFEARTRFFAGMFLAGLMGMLAALLALVIAGDIFYMPAIYLLILSIILSATYGTNLRRVRIQEVTTLTGLYLAYLQDKHLSDT